MSPADQGELRPAASVFWIQWGGFLFSHAAFLFVGLTVREQASASGDTTGLAVALSVAGFVTALASALLVPSLTRKQPFLTAMILRFALAESASIFGLVLAMLGAELEWTLILTGLGVLAHLAAAPTEREREAHAKRRASAA